MTVVVTGGTSGIGRACAELLTAQGAQVIALGRDPGKAAGAGFETAACDVTDEASVRSFLSSLKERQTPIHGWVLAAGTQEIRPLMMENYESLERGFRTNVVGSLGFMAAALKARLVAREGSIVFVSTAATQSGGAGIVGYAASKGALEAAVRSLAMELSGQKIRVNAVAPGVVMTPMSEKYMGKLTEAQRASVEAAHPLGLGTPADIAGPVAFLLSDAARWITGTVLLADGGLCCH